MVLPPLGDVLTLHAEGEAYPSKLPSTPQSPSLRLAGDCPALKTISTSGDWPVSKQSSSPIETSRLSVVKKVRGKEKKHQPTHQNNVPLHMQVEGQIHQCQSQLPPPYCGGRCIQPP